MADPKDTLAELRHWATLAHEQPGPKWSGIQGWIEDGGHSAMARTHETEDDEECDRADVDAEFIERASPATVLKLLAVVEAAKRVSEYHQGWPYDGQPSLVERIERLDAALAATGWRVSTSRHYTCLTCGHRVNFSESCEVCRLRAELREAWFKGWEAANLHRDGRDVALASGRLIGDTYKWPMPDPPSNPYPELQMQDAHGQQHGPGEDDGQAEHTEQPSSPSRREP